MIAILFDGMGFQIWFNFTLTQTLSLKGEGIFDNFLFLPLPLGIKVRGHYVIIFMLGLMINN